MDPPGIYNELYNNKSTTMVQVNIRFFIRTYDFNLSKHGLLYSRV